MVVRKNPQFQDRARRADVPELLRMAEAVGWKIEDNLGGDFTLRSPIGKHGDWATVEIHVGRGRRHVWLLTRRNYHRPGRGDRGLLSALRALHPDEQWRYQSEFPKIPLPTCCPSTPNSTPIA